MRMSAANTESSEPDASSEGYILYAALQNGTFNVFDTRASRLVYASPLARRTSALLSIANDSSSQLLATGNTTGVVAIYDIRQLPSPSSSPLNPLFSFKRSDSSIDDLLFTDSSQASPSLLVATGDGFPFRVSVSLGGGSRQVVEEYAAHADEGVRVIRTRLRHDIVDDHQPALDIWTAGDDGLARRY
jgi:WD40 repeat protein